LVENFDAFNEPFLGFPLTASRSYRKHSLSLIARSGTDSALTELRIDNQIKERHGYFIDRYSSGVFGRWRGLGILSLAPVALTGALVGMGIPEYEAKRYEERGQQSDFSARGK
jgi:hypothetical protein